MTVKAEEAVADDPKKESGKGSAAAESTKPSSRKWRLPENCVEVQRPGRTLTLIGQPRPKPASASAQLKRDK